MQRILLVLLLGLAAAPASASWHLGLGLADEIDGKHTGLATLSWLSDQRHPWEISGGYFAVRRNHAGPDVPDAVFMALSKRISGRHWFLSSGVAHVDEDNEVLSGHFQFLTGVGYARERWTVSLRHLSNASTNGRNRGETFLLLQFGL
jgi:hypothetical protein